MKIDNTMSQKLFGARVPDVKSGRSRSRRRAPRVPSKPLAHSILSYQRLHAFQKKIYGHFEKYGRDFIHEFFSPNAKVSDSNIVPMVPIIEKAGGIITDEGGITSHAAVVSREFKIPCIVGTHGASLVIKTGDLVELDADRGMVRIVKN